MHRFGKPIILPDYYDSQLEEKKITKLWNKKQITEKIKKSRLEVNDGKYLMINRPVFSIGCPHSGHILNAVVKDVFMRYAQQKHLQVENKFVWDCHGLPVEYEVDKRLEINSSQDVYNMGQAAYNAECKKFVQRNKSEWKNIYERIGSWADLTDAYETMNTEYMEGVWKVFKELYEKGLVYKDTKVLPYSTSCHTNVSNFEAQQNLNDVSEVGMTISVNICNSDEKLLVWTTTPWSLLIGSSLCVNPKTTYVKIKTHQKNKQEVVYLVSKSRLGFVFKNPRDYTILEEVSGDALEHLKCESLLESNPVSKQFNILMDCSISEDVGTGIVPLQQFILESLKERGHVVSVAKVSYKKPHCRLSGNPLVRKEMESWFIQVESIIVELIENVPKFVWLPINKIREEHLFSWLKDNCMDWSVSRTRFWGIPIPVWASPSGDERICIGSIEELEQLTGKTNIIDLHRETVDWLSIPSRVAGNPPLRRVPEVFDCWFESAAMPFIFSNTNQADICAEGNGQTHEWFYTMLVLSKALSKQPPFRNVFTTGLVMEPNGSKVSKRKHNQNDYMRLLDRYGADCMRLYLLSSPLVDNENFIIQEEKVAETYKRFIQPLYKMFHHCIGTIYPPNLENHGYLSDWYFVSNIIDEWIMSCTQSLSKFYDEEMKADRIHTLLPRVLILIEQVWDWYLPIRGPDLVLGLHTTLFNLIYKLCIILAPFAPFITEYIFQVQRLYGAPWVQEESIHEVLYTPAVEQYINPSLEQAFTRFQAIIKIVRHLRVHHIVPMEYQISELIIIHYSHRYLHDIDKFEVYIKKFLNAVEVRTSKDPHECGASLRIKPKENTTIYNDLQNFQVLGEEEIKLLIEDDPYNVEEQRNRIENLQISYEITQELDSHLAVEAQDGLLIAMRMKKALFYYEERTVQEVINQLRNFKKGANYYPKEIAMVYFSTTEECLLNLMSKHVEQLKKTTNCECVSTTSQIDINNLDYMRMMVQVKGMSIELYIKNKLT